MAWHGTAQHGAAWHRTAWHSMVWSCIKLLGAGMDFQHFAAFLQNCASTHVCRTSTTLLQRRVLSREQTGAEQRLGSSLATFLATTSHSTSKQTAKCRRAEAAGLLVKRTSVASMMRSGLMLGLLEFIEQEHKSLVHLKGVNPRFGKGVEADLKASSDVVEDAVVNHPPVLDDQAVEEPMERDPVTEEEVDVDDEDNEELLPSVDMSRVPSIFRQQIARVLPTCDPEC
jgi:hypothetical protein